MQVSNKHVSANSVEEFVDSIRVLATAGAPVVHARTDEVPRALAVLRENLLRDGSSLVEWDVVNGSRHLTPENYRNRELKGNENADFTEEFTSPQKDLVKNEEDDDRFHYYVYVNPQFWIENNPIFLQMLLHYEEVLPTTTTRIILLSLDTTLSHDAEQRVTTVRLTPPGINELRGSLDTLLDSSSIPEEELFGSPLTDDEKLRICYTGAGLSRSDFELYTSWAIAEAVYHDSDNEALTVDSIVKGISRGKTEIVGRSDILELIPAEDITQVGGMDLLKKWINQRKNCFTDAAAEFGVEPPKGVVFVGPPGVGKSLAAKSVAGVFGVPVVRLDFGRVFNSYIGKSEERVRKALAMCESMAPVVLFCVRGNTELTLSDGTRVTAADLYEKHHSVNESFTLQGVNPDTGELQPLPLRTMIRTQGKHMVRIETESGRSIEVTTDHRLLVKRGDYLVWVQVSELKEGDDLVEIDQ